MLQICGFCSVHDSHLYKTQFRYSSLRFHIIFMAYACLLGIYLNIFCSVLIYLHACGLWLNLCLMSLLLCFTN